VDEPGTSRPPVADGWEDDSPATDAGVEETSGTIPLHWVRRLCLTALTLVVLLAASSAWWPTTSSTAGNTALGITVSHEHHLRPGTDSMVEVAVTRAAAGPLTLRVDRDLLTVAGITDVRPAPDRQQDADTMVSLVWADAAAHVDVVLEGRVPTRQPPGRQTWLLEVSDGRRSVPVETHLWVLP
jgi:hypothetical protein